MDIPEVFKVIHAYFGEKIRNIIRKNHVLLIKHMRQNAKVRSRKHSEHDLSKVIKIQFNDTTTVKGGKTDDISGDHGIGKGLPDT